MEWSISLEAYTVLLVLLQEICLGKGSELTQKQSGQNLEISCTLPRRRLSESFCFNSPENVLEDGNKYSIDTGRDAATLTIKALRVSDEGKYFCRIQNWSGRYEIVGSTEVEILKLQALEINASQESSILHIDCLQYISDSEFKGFFKDSSSDVLANNKKYKITDLDGGKRLSITNPQENDQGTYTCKIMLKGVVTDANTTVVISELKSYAIITEAIILERGKPGNIDVAIKGKSPKLINWYHESTHVFHGNFNESSVVNADTRYSAAANGSLIITDVREQDKGKYCLSLDDSESKYCTSVNTAGIPTKMPLLLGQEGTLSFSLDGDLTTDIRWTRKLQNTSKVIFNEHYQTTASNEKYALTSSGSLTIKEVNITDEGFYGVELIPHNFHKMIRLVVVGIILTSPTYFVAGDVAQIEAQIRTEEGQKSVTWKKIDRSHSDTELLSSTLGQQKAVNRHQITATGSLHVTNVTKEDSGEYCVDVTPSSPPIRKCVFINVTELCRSPSMGPKCSPLSECNDVDDGYRCRCLPGYVKWKGNCVSGKLFEVRDLRFNETWKEEYGDKSSKAYIKLVGRLESTLEQGCRPYDCFGCRINELKQGSILVTFTVIFNVSSSASLTTVIQFIQALQQDLSNTVVEDKNGADAQATASSLCDVRGESCGSYGDCIVEQDGKGYHCQCHGEARKDNDGKCHVQDEIKEKSGSIVIIIVPACLSIILVIVIIVFIVVLRRRRSLRAKKNQNSSKNVGVRSPGTTPSHNNVIDLSKESRKVFGVNPVYLQSRAVKYNKSRSTEDKNNSNEPVYADYDTVKNTYETPRKDKSLNSFALKAQPVYAVYDDGPKRQKITTCETYAEVDEKFGKESLDEPIYALYG